MNKYYVKAWFLNKSSNNMYKLSNKAYIYEVDKLVYDNVCREVLGYKESSRVDSWNLTNESGYKYSNPAILIPILSDHGHLAMIENDISIKKIKSREFEGNVFYYNIIDFCNSILKEAICDFVRDYTLKEKCEKNQPLTDSLNLGSVKINDSGWFINTNSTECDTSGLKIDSINSANTLVYHDTNPNTISIGRDGIDIAIGSINVVDRFDELNERVSALEKNNNNETRKEKNTMNIMKNFDFGPASSVVYKMSPYGMAVKNKDGFVALNKETNDIIDVTGMTFDVPGMIYKMPVAIKDVKAGDVIIHNGTPMHVTHINDGNNIVAIDFVAHEHKCIVPTKSPFGFNFVTKVVCLAESMFGNMATPDESNPFGGMLLPMMLMGSESKDNKDMFKTMMLMNMMNGGNGATMDMSNPMTMMCFMNMMD